MLVRSLLETAGRSPNVTAVSDSVRSMTFRQLVRVSAAMRSILLRETACPRVGIMLPASSAFPAVLFGTLWASKVAVPLNFLIRAEELGPIIEDAKLDLIVTIRHFKDLVSRLPARAVMLEDLPLKRQVVLRTVLPTPPLPDLRPDDTAVILYTSGTTGVPKGVELSQRNLHTNCVDTIALLEIEPNHRFLNVLPPFHVFGLTACVLVPVTLGATVYALPRFSPVGVVKTIRENKITVMLAIPSMYGAVLKTKSACKETFQSIYLAVSGGEPLSNAVRDGFVERFGVPLREGYGLTETSPVISAESPAAHKTGTVGRLLRSLEIKIVDDKGNSASEGSDGEILVRGPTVMKGYYGHVEETRKVIDNEGWFHTGDIGHLDGDGFLSITGRAKEMLIIGGENVFPREIEAALESHESVLQAAVIGMPDDMRGEVPVAFILRQPDATVDESTLRNHVKSRLAGFKVPKRIEICEDLPTGPSGKILKRFLRERL